MITNSLIGVFFKMFGLFNALLAPLHFSFDESLFLPFKDILAFIFYILPVDGLFPIVLIIISITVFRIGVSVIKTIWDLLPIL